jgi:hypothetical protein
MNERIPKHERGSVCPLCLTTLGRSYLVKSGDLFDVDCRTCGFYRVSGTFEMSLIAADDSLLALIPPLRSHVRQAADKGQPVTLRTDNYATFAASHVNTPLEWKLRRALELLADAPGKWHEFETAQFGLRIDARDGAETEFLLKDLQARHLIEHETRQGPPFSELGEGHHVDQFRLTVDGWKQISPLRTDGAIGLVFVAMWFDDSLDAAFEAIRSAIESDCGLQAYRVDRIQHNDQITDRILAGIRASQFTVADVTGQRQGVYFEAGFAMGLGRDVIWCCREDELSMVHFDTRQFSHVVWKSPADLRQKLAARIRGTVLTPMKLL